MKAVGTKFVDGRKFSSKFLKSSFFFKGIKFYYVSAHFLLHLPCRSAGTDQIKEGSKSGKKSGWRRQPRRQLKKLLKMEKKLKDVLASARSPAPNHK